MPCRPNTWSSIICTVFTSSPLSISSNRSIYVCALSDGFPEKHCSLSSGVSIVPIAKRLPWISSVLCSILQAYLLQRLAPSALAVSKGHSSVVAATSTFRDVREVGRKYQRQYRLSHQWFWVMQWWIWRKAKWSKGDSRSGAIPPYQASVRPRRRYSELCRL